MNKSDAELAQLEGTGFWKYYQRRAQAFRKSTMEDLRRCDITLVGYQRGVLDGMDFLLKLPEEFSRVTDKSDEGDLDNG